MVGCAKLGCGNPKSKSSASLVRSFNCYTEQAKFNFWLKLLRAPTEPRFEILMVRGHPLDNRSFTSKSFSFVTWRVLYRRYMHQFGVGVPRDLHIAKRYYDLSLQQNADAYLPVGIALVGLRIHNFYQSYSGIKAPALDFRGAHCFHTSDIAVVFYSHAKHVFTIVLWCPIFPDTSHL